VDKKIRIREEHPESFFQELRNSFGFKILKFFNAVPPPGSFSPGIRDGKILIRDPV
jgi:hypothetical protein